jgi:hypothetical protein
MIPWEYAVHRTGIPAEANNRQKITHSSMRNLNDVPVDAAEHQGQ